MLAVNLKHTFILVALCIFASKSVFAENTQNSVDVQQYLQQSQAEQLNNPQKSADNISQVGRSLQATIGGSSELFNSASDLTKKKQTTGKKTPVNARDVSVGLPTLPSKQKNGTQGVQTGPQKELAAAIALSGKASSNQPATPYVPVDIPTAQDINEASFDAIKQEAFPLSPNQIKAMRNMLDETQRATAAEPFDSPPQPTSSSLMVNLAPGMTPPVIRLYRGFVSSLVFVDSTGAPWPIVAYDLGNPTAFNIAWNAKDNLLMVQAQTGYTYGNLAVKLENLDTPVMLTLVPGQRAVDYRVDLRIMGYGPNAKQAYSGASNNPQGTSSTLLNILDGVPPQGAKRLKVQGDRTEAWLYEDNLYLRTAYSLLSPAWVAKLSSADGMNAYELPKTPLVLISRHGKTAQMKLEGY